MSIPNLHLGFVHRFTPGADASQPTLLLLHGTGGDESEMISLGKKLLPKAAMLSPRGKALENGMSRFFRRSAQGVFDLEDLKFRTHELAGFVEAAAEAYHLDRSQMIAVGFSNGANIAASLLLLHPGLLYAAVLFSPTVPLVPERKPELAGTAVLIVAGRADPLVGVEETERLVKLLQDARAEVTLHWHWGGHTINDGQIEAAKDWLHRILGRKQEHVER